jgi:hypothetical protein
VRKTIVLLSIISILGTPSLIGAQTVYMNLTDAQPIGELGIPFAQDSYFFANYSSNTAVVYVNGKEVGTVPANSYRRAQFYVASNTRVEAFVNLVTDRGTRRVKMKRQGIVIQKKDGTVDSGWMFYQ